MKDFSNDWHKSGINETKMMFKRIFIFIKFLSIICFLLMTFFLVIAIVLIILWLFPSFLVIQGVYLTIFAFRKKIKFLFLISMFFNISVPIVFIAFGIWANPSLNYSFKGPDILSSMFLIELKFLPLFLILYMYVDWSIYLFHKKVIKWYEYRKANYIFVNRFIEVWIWLIICIKFCSFLIYLMNTRKSVLQAKMQWQNENVLLNDDVALNKDKLNQHTLLIGATGSGKTTTVLSIINQLVYKLNQTVIIVDGKGDTDLIDKIQAIDKNVFLWTINGENQYNPFSSKSYIVLADKIMSLFDFTEPHYQAIAHDYLLILLKTLQEKNIAITLQNIIKHFAINDLKNIIDKQNPKYDYVLGFNSQQINGLLSRLSVYANQLGNSVDINNDLLQLTKKHKILLFSLNSLSYPQLASNMGKLLIQDLKEFASIKPKALAINLVLDEFNVFASDNVINLINKTRSFNYHCFLCFQVTDDLSTDKKILLNTIFGNVGNIIAHNVTDVDSPEYLAKVFGTIKTVKLTRQLDFFNRTRNMGSVRETEEFIFHPNDFKNLARGVVNIKIINQNLNHQPFSTFKIKIKDYNRDCQEIKQSKE